MNQTILDVKNKILKGHKVTKQEVIECQKAESNELELFTTYWIMSRYYLERNEQDALTYCILKCYELNEFYKFDLEYKVKNFLDARSDFMQEAINKTKTKLIPIAIFFGVLLLVAFWLIIGDGGMGGFVIGFIVMNIVSIKFLEIGSKKTIEAFKKKQYAAVYEFLDENDKKFVDEH